MAVFVSRRGAINFRATSRAAFGLALALLAVAAIGELSEALARLASDHGFQPAFLSPF